MLVCYNTPGVVEMSARVEELLREVQKLNAEELHLLCQALLRKIAVPLQDPVKIYDDWDDPEVDAAYAKPW